MSTSWRDSAISGAGVQVVPDFSKCAALHGRLYNRGGEASVCVVYFFIDMIVYRGVAVCCIVVGA
jgi:hypothetical protein